MALAPWPWVLARDPWPGDPWLGGTLGPGAPRPSGGPWPRQPLGRGGRGGALGPAGPWPANPCLARGALKPLARGALGRGALGPAGPWPGGPWPGGPLARGALGPGGPWPGGPLGRPKIRPQNHEIEQPACLDPSPASWSRNPAARGQGAPGGGGPANPEPKTLNHLQRQRVTIWGYTLATLKVVWVPAIP